MTDVTNTTETAAPSDSLLDTPEANSPDPSTLDFSKGKPEGFPDDFWDVEKNAPKVTDLYAKYQEAEQRAKGLRDKLAKGAQNAPKDPKEYEVKLSDEVAKVIKSDDPMFEEARKVAHKHGLSKEAFNGFMAEMAEFVAKNAQAQPADPEAAKAEAEAYKAEQLAKLGETGPQIVRAIAAWGNELAAQGYFTEADHKTFKDMAYSAESVRVLNMLRSMVGGGKEVPMAPASDGKSRAELEAELVKAFTTGDEARYNEIERQLGSMRKAG
jgi:hypothetical protein